MSEDAQASDAQVAETPVDQQAYDSSGETYAPAPQPSMVGRMLGNKFMLLGIVAVVIVVVVAAAMSMGGGVSLFGPSKPTTTGVKLGPMTGSSDIKGPQVAVGQTDEQAIKFGGGNDTNGSEVTNVYEVTAACSWTDDMAGSEPDEMLFELTSPDGQNKSADTTGTSGSCSLSIKITNMTSKKVDDNTAGWKLKVTCKVAGHQDVGPFGRLIYVDAGNNYDAKISYSYYGASSAKK
jgi:hypothetical protein